MKTATQREIEKFRSANPVRQSHHTGLWGFARVYDSLDLNRCIYASKRAAEMARSEAAQAWVSDYLST